MATTYIATEEDFLSWDGSTSAQLTNNFILTNDSYFPKILGAGITLNGYGKTIEIDIVSAGNFSGLVMLDGGDIRNLKVIVSGGSITNQNGWIIETQNLNRSIGNISNVCLFVSDNIAVTIPDSSGGFLGSHGGGNNAHSLIVTNCYYEGPIAQYHGGITGSYSRNIDISNCYINIVGDANANSGGLLGSQCNNCNIDSCIISKATPNSTDYAAGVVGCMSTNCIISNSYSLFSSAANYCSGFFGYDCANCEVSSSYYYGTLTGSDSNSFFIFINNIGIEEETPTNTITNCFTTTNNFSMRGCFVSAGTNLINYTTSIDNSNEPMLSFSLSKWDLSTQPPILDSFLSLPWENYTQYDSVPLPMRCILSGTFIRTIDGEVKIDDLKTGDILKTPTGTTIIKNIISMVTYAQNERIPLKISRDSYGKGFPYDNLYLSPLHMIYSDGEFKHAKHTHFRAKKFMNKKIKYYHIMTTNYDDIIYANGLPVETYHLKKLPCKECVKKIMRNNKLKQLSQNQ